jgi:hypothetical protein
MACMVSLLSSPIMQRPPKLDVLVSYFEIYFIKLQSGSICKPPSAQCIPPVVECERVKAMIQNRRSVTIGANENGEGIAQ